MTNRIRLFAGAVTLAGAALLASPTPAFSTMYRDVLDPLGTGVLLQLPKGASWADVSWVIFLIFVAITSLAAGLQGWLLKQTNALERALLVASGVLVIIPVGSLDAVGVALLAVVFVLQMLRKPRTEAVP